MVVDTNDDDRDDDTDDDDAGGGGGRCHRSPTAATIHPVTAVAVPSTRWLNWTVAVFSDKLRYQGILLFVVGDKISFHGTHASSVILGNVL